ncbi:MAG: DUF2065 domain-containing protein [Candidatus Aminicenantes bacterium]|nr:DUF2065 domain-containing protein [Candidatus Aminicenantes bacterium]
MTLWLILIILGSIMIIEALPMFIAPLKMKEYYRRIADTDPRTLQIMAFVMIITGLVIVFLVRTKICL